MTLYSTQSLTAAFAVLVVISNVISSKLFPLPFIDDFFIPAGLMTYPLTFFLSDLMTEIHGVNCANKMVKTALFLSVVSYLVIQMALWLPGGDPQFESVFQEVLGVNGWIVAASLFAFAVAQTLDIYLYGKIKNITGEKMLWLRNNGSTLISQLVDTFAVNGIYLYIGLGMEASLVLNAIYFSYLYKAAFSILGTPLFYWAVSRARSASNAAISSPL